MASASTTTKSTMKVLTFSPATYFEEDDNPNLVGFFSMELSTQNLQEMDKYLVRHGETVKIVIPEIEFHMTFVMDIDELEECTSCHECLHYSSLIQNGDIKRTIAINFVPTDKRTIYGMSAISMYYEDPETIAQKVDEEKKAVTCECLSFYTGCRDGECDIEHDDYCPNKKQQKEEPDATNTSDSVSS